MINEDMKIVPLMQPNKLFITERHDHVLYEYYLLGNIGDPEDYIDLCHALRSARPEDQFLLRFNSGGGQVRTGNQIANSISESDATTIGFIEHDCGSMCTFLFLACDTWGVSKYAEWFSHTVSGGNYGKECETYEASVFLRKQTHKRIREEYKNFLTEDEIEKILTGTDIYLNADEIMERLEFFAEAREEEMMAEEGGEQPPSLADIIKTSLSEILDERGISKPVINSKPVNPKVPKAVKKAVEAPPAEDVKVVK